MDRSRYLRYFFIPLLWVAVSSYAAVCDLDDDGDVDRIDIQLLAFERGNPVVPPDDPRDPNLDGVIDNQDIRQCNLLCTLPRCASPAANQAPVADAGPNQSEPIFSLIQLDGSGSTDADGDSLTFAWQILTQPVGSTAILSDDTAVMPTFSIDVSGDYTIELVVNDGTVDSAPDTVLISTENTPPTADAGNNQSGQVFDLITLDGSGSDDADNDSLSFNWQFITRPGGSAATLDDPTAVMPSFTIDETGDYVLELVVNDGQANSLPDTVSVSTDNTPPVAEAGPNQSGQIGDTITLDGTGSSDVNGDPLTYAWNFTSTPLGSTATLSGASSAAPQFTIDVNGDYVVQLIVNDGLDDSVPDTVVVSTDNTPPVADAGNDDSAEIGQSVTLDGSGSTDVDGDTLTYLWSFISRPTGSSAALSDDTAINPSFTLDATGDYVLQLVVNDGQDDSAPSTVTISTDNTAPVADAGPGQTPLVGDIVTLDGSGSSDANGDPLTYLWTITDNPGGSAAALSDNTLVNPQFTIDLPGTYEVTLVVNDGQASSAPDSVLLITANSAPIADAGPPQTAFVSQTVTLDGTGSTDVDGDALTFNWSLLSQPIGSTSSLSDNTAAMPTLLIDAFGTYQVQLIVNDGSVDSAPDTVTISTDNTAPVANAGPDQTPFVNETVTLDGSASSDVDGDSLTYDWSLTTQPASSSATLNDDTAVMPQFTVDEPGTYVAQLTVNDGLVDSAPDTVTISTLNSTPIAEAGPNQSVNLSDTVLLDGSGSSDADGDLLSFDWSLIGRPIGSTATLNDNTLVNPEFTVDLAGTYTAQLVVNDGTTDSAPDTVTISTNNTRPVADAGPNQTPDVGDTATLDGTGSSDADGDGLTYAWSIISRPAGSTAAPANPTAATTTIGIDQPGTYIAQLIVNDGIIDSLPDTATLVTNNRAPVAEAGNNQSIETGQTASFDGSGSSDPDNDGLSFAWTLISAPVGSTAALVDGNTQTPELTPDLVGTYTLQLIVNDGDLDSAPDTVDLEATATLANLSISSESVRVGVGRTVTGTVTLALPAPVGGVTVNLVSDQPGIATVSPASVFIAEAEVSAQFDINGVSEGAAPLTASATGYNSDSTTVQVTSAIITLGDPGDLAPGQSASLAVSISSPAPAGGVTVNLTSSNANIVSVDASIFIPEGQQVPAANPQVTGDQIGDATITATTTLFAPDSRDITVTLVTSFAENPFNITAGTTDTVQVNISAPAPTGGLTYTMLSANPAIATVPANLTIPQGQLSAQLDVTGVSNGSTTVTLSAAGIPDAVLDVNVDNPPPINFVQSDLQVGKDLQASRGGSLSEDAPAGNLTVTYTSSDPALALVSSSSTGTAGTTTTVQVNAGNSGIPAVFVHALQNTGSVTITASAPGYANGTFPVELRPSGVIINSPGNFSTTVFANNTNVQIRTYRLNESTLNISTVQNVRSGFTVNAEVISSNTAVGVITTSPVTINAGGSLVNTAFDPLSAGTTTVSVTPPAGLSTPGNFQSIVATVNAPNINLSSFIVGEDLTQARSVTLQSAPPTPTNVTVTSNDPTVAIVSTDPNVVGSSSITFSGVTGTFAGTVYVQGISTGNTTLTITAAGYNTQTTNVTVDPSGFIINAPGSINTTTFASNTNVQLRSYRLNPTTLGISAVQNLRAGVTADLTVTSSDTNVGVITVAPVNMPANSSLVNTQFDPLNSGTSTLAIQTPTGWDTPSNFQSITATVTAPDINFSDALVGRDLQQSRGVSLQSAPPSAVDVTLTVADPAIALISTSNTAVGSGSVTFNGVGSTSVGTIHVQGLAEGVTTITATAPGYEPRIRNVTVNPSGFIVNSPGSINTTNFSPNTTVQIRPYRLLPGTLGISAVQPVRPGVTADVPVISSDTNVGVITASPLTFTGNVSLINTAFDPIAAGVTTVSVGTPTGFTTPSNFQSITATVSAPNINISATTVVGKNLQRARGISLQAAPPAPVDVIVSSNAPGIALISTDPNAVGTNSVTFSGVSGTNVGTIYVQGIETGGTTIVASAAGYNDGTTTVTVDPSGIIINSPGNFTTSAGAANTNIQLRSYRLNPTTLNIASVENVRGGLTVDVEVTSSATGVGVITTSPVTISGNSNIATTAFDPIAAGTTQLEVQVPSGFSAPSNFKVITVTVNP